MNILVVGGDGRAHALARAIGGSPFCGELFFAPGNAGTAQLGANLNHKVTDIEALGRIAQSFNIGLVVVSPEVPLAMGLVDHLNNLGIPAFGPTKAAAQIEASKKFAKDLMLKYGIPTANSRHFVSLAEAQDYARSQKPPIVIKAVGLAAGKGVVVAQSQQEAQETLIAFMEKRVLGDACNNGVLIEECLYGKEVSLLAFTDGNTVVPMVPACDYKRRDDNDGGPNTGGMGSYSADGILNPGEAIIGESILQRAVKAMAVEGCPFKGVLYAGLIRTDEGLKVLEFNCRFGDPETQVILPRLETDLLGIMLAVINGTLDRIKIEWSKKACVGVVMASGGYPGSYKTGFPIQGPRCLPPEVAVFQAGTKQDPEHGTVLTDGGRVLSVAALGETVAEARSLVYQNLPEIKFEGAFYRHDIAAGL